MRRVAALLITMLFGGGGGAMAGEPLAWVVYYSDEAPVSAFEPYELVVLDSDHHPRLQPLRDRGKTLLGYISLGEVERHRSHYEAVRAEGILLQENEFWPGSFFVDVRDPRWTARVVEELVPAILQQGFDGIFLDTLDNPEELERMEPERYAGMTEAAVRLVKAIRLHYPEIEIMLNRGYRVLAAAAGSVDYALGECVYADYDFGTGLYGLTRNEDYLWQIEQLEAARGANPELQLLTLDYWDPEDEAGIADIYRRQRERGLAPYVATIALDRIIPEPRR